MDITYFVFGYIDDSYFVYTANAESSISGSSTMTIDARKLYPSYFEVGYIDPDYFAHIADGVANIVASSQLQSTATIIAPSGTVKEFEAALSVNASSTVNAVKTVTAQTSLSCTFAQTTQANRINDITLFAFGNANIAVAVSRIRSINTTMSTTATIVATGSRSRLYTSAQAATTDINVINYRVRNDQAALSAASSWTSGPVEITAAGTRTRATIVGDLNA